MSVTETTATLQAQATLRHSVAQGRIPPGPTVPAPTSMIRRFRNEKINLFLCGDRESVVVAYLAEGYCHHLRLCGLEQHLQQYRRIYCEVTYNGPDLSDLLRHDDHFKRVSHGKPLHVFLHTRSRARRLRRVRES